MLEDIKLAKFQRDYGHLSEEKSYSYEEDEEDEE